MTGVSRRVIWRPTRSTTCGCSSRSDGLKPRLPEAGIDLGRVERCRDAVEGTVERLDLVHAVALEEDDIARPEEDRRGRGLPEGGRVELVASFVQGRPDAEPSAAGGRLQHGDERQRAATPGYV